MVNLAIGLVLGGVTFAALGFTARFNNIKKNNLSTNYKIEIEANKLALKAFGYGSLISISIVGILTAVLYKSLKNKDSKFLSFTLKIDRKISIGKSLYVSDISNSKPITQRVNYKNPLEKKKDMGLSIKYKNQKAIPPYHLIPLKFNSHDPSSDVFFKRPLKNNLFEKFYDTGKETNYENFCYILKSYTTNNPHYQRGLTEFVYQILSNIYRFEDAAYDLKAYKEILKLYPKGKFASSTEWLGVAKWFPKQQECCHMLLHTMQMNGVYPDEQFGYMLMDIFGRYSDVLKQYQRYMFWSPKFLNLPYKPPSILPKKWEHIAKAALVRFWNDYTNNISNFSINDKSIVSIQSETQKEMINQLNPSTILYVKGPDILWYGRQKLFYYTLYSVNNGPTFDDEIFEDRKCQDLRDHTKWKFTYGGDKIYTEEKNEMNQYTEKGGIVYACCIPQINNPDSIRQWIDCLKPSNPILAKLQIVENM
ncbi:Evolutionarily conserved signaling intermediate in Toll pathway, mitochondrial [Intoshia linei]|uniref:Evolutionarily conserved signaling intermediate in Toll pathway, mitochondrial n=1 Tax=Intoshia linei TaxID=1819745 RepID=A0A177B1A4_9BILA|nr:Evolutionarily conserved signaling intermediate in Toll pathway, mitochondrial [Intoshia linei]